MKSNNDSNPRLGNDLKAALVLVVVALAASGCLTGVNADEVRNDSLSAMEDVETYDYEMDMEMEMAAGDTPGSISIEMDTNGSVDEANRQMSAHSAITSFGFEFGQEAYVVNETMYMTMGMSGHQEAPQWYKIQNDSMVSQTWESSSYAEQYRDVLEISEVEYEEDESVNGENAYVLTLDPDVDEYNQLVREQMAGMSGMQGNEGMGEFFSEDSIKVQNVSMRYWISEETGYILRTQSNTTMTMEFGLGEESGERFEGSELGGAPDEMTVEMDTDVRLTNHGEDVDIELPDGTEDAEEFDSLFEAASKGGTSASRSVSVSEPASENGKENEIVEVVEIETTTDEGVPPVARVYFNDPLDVDSVTIEAVEGGHSSSDTPESIEYLSTTLDPEGDEIVVSVREGNETRVVHRESYTP